MTTTTLTMASALLLTLPVFAKAPVIAAKDQELLKLVEESSPIAIHFNNLKTFEQNWEKSPLKAFWESEEIQKIVKKAKTKALNESDDSAKNAQFLKTLEALIDLLEEEALIEVSLPKIDQHLFEKIDAESADLFNEFGVHAFVELGEKREEFLKLSTSLLNQGLSEGKKIQSVTLSGIDFQFIEVSLTKEKDEEASTGPKISIGVHDQMGIISIGGDLAILTKRIKNGAVDSIQDADFRVNRVCDIEILGNTTLPLRELKKMLTEMVAEEESLQQMAINVDGAWEKIGFDGLGGYSYILDMSQPTHEIFSKIAFSKEGLVGSLIPNKSVEEMTSLAGKDALSSSMLSYDFTSIYDRLIETVQTVSPMASMMVLGQLQQMEKGLGLKLKEDLIQHFDGEIQVINYKPEGDDIPEKAAYVVKVKDANKVSAALATINGISGQEAKVEKFLEVDITELGLGAQMGAQQSIGYAIVNQQLIIGGITDGAVKEVIKQLKNPQATIWEKESVKNYVSTLPNGYIGLEYASLQKTIDSAFKQMKAIGADAEDFDYSNLELPFNDTIGASYYKNGFVTSQGAFLPKEK